MLLLDGDPELFGERLGFELTGLHRGGVLGRGGALRVELGADRAELIDEIGGARCAVLAQRLLPCELPRVVGEDHLLAVGALEPREGVDGRLAQQLARASVLRFEIGDGLPRRRLRFLGVGELAVDRIERSLLRIDRGVERLEIGGELVDVTGEGVDLADQARLLLLDLAALLPQLLGCLVRRRERRRAEADDHEGDQGAKASERVSGAQHRFVTRSQRSP
ncbi:MAG: hypothetical protein R2695_16210 [Acidimicrobiales bacterium]